ncbi:MAG: DUF89 family protein [Lentisphaeria bacterium]|nr:DUF89 family protein [Lentisphaeria bacterium]
MQIQYGCYKCIFNMLSDMAQKAFSDDHQRRQLLKLLLAEVIENSEKFTPPEMAAKLYDIYHRETGVYDPFAEEKHHSTLLAKELFPLLEPMVASAADPFAMAVKLAIGGNVIDFGATPFFKLDSARKAILETARSPVDTAILEELRCRAGKAEKIFYILDNCGEAVIDRLLINALGAEKITLGVRGRAIFNDITRKELADSGLGDLPVIDTGDNAPGVSLKFSDPGFLEYLRNADLVIAKGQGNFESLNDAPGNGNIFFLFRVKCPVVENLTGCAAGSLQIRRGKN